MSFEPLRLVSGRIPTGGELRAFQSARTRELVRHAGDRVPFYREIWRQAGVEPGDVRSPSDLGYLPIVRRADLQEAAPEALVARGTRLEACVLRQSGGSTGRPLSIHMSRREAVLEALGWLRTWRRLGLRLRDLQAAIKDPDDTLDGGRRRWFQRLGLLRVRHFDALRCSPEAIARELAEIRPHVVRGTPSALLGVAERLSGSGGAGARTRRVFTAGEVLTAGARAVLEEGFGAPVRDCYGASEAGCIGWRCPECGRMHVNGDQVILEAVKDGRPAEPGEVGEVVVTNLFARTMPFVRVALGDLCRVADPDGCPAGEGSLAIAELLGREVDRIVLADGRTVSPYVFMPDDAEWVKEYQVLQDEPGAVKVMVVPGEGFSGERVERERRMYEEMVDGACIVSFEVVDAIRKRPGEKHRPVISRVSPSAAPPAEAAGPRLA